MSPFASTTNHSCWSVFELATNDFCLVPLMGGVNIVTTTDSVKDFSGTREREAGNRRTWDLDLVAGPNFEEPDGERGDAEHDPDQDRRPRAAGDAGREPEERHEGRDD